MGFKGLWDLGLNPKPYTLKPQTLSPVVRMNYTRPNGQWLVSKVIIEQLTASKQYAYMNKAEICEILRHQTQFPRVVPNAKSEKRVVRQINTSTGSALKIGSCTVEAAMWACGREGIMHAPMDGTKWEN